MKMKLLTVALLLTPGARAAEPELGAELFKLKDATVVYADALEKKPGGWFLWGKTAAEEMAKALSLATGGDVRAYPEAKAPADGRKRIYMGDTAAARAEGYRAEGLSNLVFRIVGRDDAAYIVAKTHVAAQYGATEFLERFADYWYIWQDGRDPYVTDPARAMRACDFTVRPAIYYREMHLVDKRNLCGSRNYLSRIRGWCGFGDCEVDTAYRVCTHLEKGRYLLGDCHSNYAYVPPETYFKTHPEFYTMNARGERFFAHHGGSQLCYSNPELLEVVFTNLCNFVEMEKAKNPGRERMLFDFSQQDSTGVMCFCPKCREIIAKYNRVPGGHAEGGDAGLQLEFLNKLARRARERYPEIRLRTFAYVNTCMPPKPGTIVPEPNVCIWLCDMYGSSDHSLALTHPFNRPQADMVRRWSEITKNLMIWDYQIGGAEYWDIQADAALADPKFFRDNGVDYLFTQVNFSFQPFFELNRFLQAHMYLDPDRDGERLVDVFCRSYGAAAPEMRAAIDYARQVTRERPPRNVAEWSGRSLVWRSDPEVVGRMRALAQAAYDKLPAGLERARVARVLAGADRQCVDCYRKAKGMRGKVAEALAAYRAHAEEMLLAGPYEGKALDEVRRDVADYVDTADMRFDDLPEALRQADPDSLYFFDYHLLQKYGYCYDEYNTNDHRYAAQKIRDAESCRGRAVYCCYGQKPRRPLRGATNDTSRRHGHFEGYFRWADLPEDLFDGKYHWIRGEHPLHVRRNTNIFVTDAFSCGVAGSSVYMECDGFEKDPNWFEVWASVRFQGRDWVKGDARDNAVIFDRAVLRRLPEPPPDWEKLMPPPDKP